MNVICWIVQVVLAIKFLSVVYSHGIHPDLSKMEQGRQRFGAAAPAILIAASVGAFLGAMGLVLPAMSKALAWLAPWAATMLAGMMLAAIFLHLGCRDRRTVWVGVVLLVLSTLVAYGRWVLAPL